MKKSGTILDFSIAELTATLAKGILGIDELCNLISIATDPEQLKLLKAALMKAKLKEAAKVKQWEDEAKQICDHAQEARARLDRAEKVIQQTNDLIRRLIKDIGARTSGSSFEG